MLRGSREPINRNLNTIMKHIQRRFLYQLNKEELASRGSFEEADLEANPDIPEDKRAFYLTDLGYALPVFQVKINKQRYNIPEPDPVCLYFNNAQIHSRFIVGETKKLLETLTYTGEVIQASAIAHSTYSYFYHASSYAVFLFTAIEAGINKALRPAVTYCNRKGEILDMVQIQRQIPFLEKVKKVLPSQYGRNFVLECPAKFESIIKLKSLRDELVHTKKPGGVMPSYSHILSDALNFNYELTLLNVRDFINSYNPKLIVECDCGNDF